MVTPENGSDVCAPFTSLFSVSNTGVAMIELLRSDARLNFSLNLTPMSQFDVGDVNGDDLDGNLADHGEFGSYYSGPVAATIALKELLDQGMTNLINAQEAMQLVAEDLAEVFHTRENRGTYDEELYFGLKQYTDWRGASLEMTAERFPDYIRLRSLVEEQRHVAILGVSGSPGAYLTIDGFSGWRQGDNTYLVRVANPLTGTIQQVPWRDGATFSQVFFSGDWHTVDIAIHAYQQLDRLNPIIHDLYSIEMRGQCRYPLAPNTLPLGRYRL